MTNEVSVFVTVSRANERTNERTVRYPRRDRDDDDDDDDAWITDAFQRRRNIETSKFTKDKRVTAFQQKQQDDEHRRVEGGVDVVRAIK